MALLLLHRPFQEKRCGPRAAAAQLPDELRRLEPLLRRRGPDAFGHVTVLEPGAGAQLHIVASLLQLRGSRPVCSTPLTGAALLRAPNSGAGTPADPNSAAVLAYNGEIFSGLPEVDEDVNDGHALLTALLEAQDAAGSTPPQRAQHITALLSRLSGPWAIIFWDASTRTLWFGRDALGRRSLLMKWQQPAGTRDGQPSLAGGTCITMSSVADQGGSAAADAGSAPLVCHEQRHHHDDDGDNNNNSALPIAATWRPWEQGGEDDGRWQEVPPGMYSLTLTPPDSADSHAAATAVLTARFAHHAWCQGHASRSLAMYQRPAGLQAPPGHPDPCAAPPPGTVIRSNAATLLRQQQQQQQQEQQAKHDKQEDTAGELAAAAGQPPVAVGGQGWRAGELGPDAAAAVDRVDDLLRAAVRMRCTGIHPLHHPSCDMSVLVLFSGGADSTLLAALAHTALPPGVPIDLSNVCFDRGRSPDRLAAIDALKELQRFAPDRPWRLILVDATLEDVDRNRQHLLTLLRPAGTVMDLNIGAALWLAVGANGRLHVPLNPSNRAPAEPDGGVYYRSRARVVLLGTGADEQCAGYGRHRTRFAEAGWRGLSDELCLDVRRLWLRNLGRDDRLVADWGREARHPFLDEALMLALLRDTPLPAIADLCAPPGLGDKMVLRAVLARLGLPGAASRVKRAIQFGTRIGKLANVRDFGSNRAANRASAGGVPLSALQPPLQKP